MKFSRFALTAIFALAAVQVQAATFSLSGNARIGSNLYNNLDLAPGTRAGSGNTSSYLEGRFLLRPEVLVDRRFSVLSEWIFLQQGNDNLNEVPEAFGSALDGSLSPLFGNQFFYMRRAWLQWASDWGIFSFGRMPKSWGLGVLYHAGMDPLHDFGSTVDRVGFKAMLGNLIINLGYEKGAEARIHNDNDDIDVYELSLEYTNSESLFDVGILYDRKVVGAASTDQLVNPTDIENSAHVLSFYSKKRWGQFQLGGELASIAQDRRTNSIGVLTQMDFMPGNLHMNLDLAYASASSNSVFTFHPNYQPFLLLFRQSLTTAAPVDEVRGGLQGSNRVGSDVGEGNGAGAYLAKLGVQYAFSQERFVLGGDLGYAALSRKANNPGQGLGVEFDLHLSQKWYENFKTHYSLGLLFPGEGLRSAAQMAWGFQVRGALTF